MKKHIKILFLLTVLFISNPGFSQVSISMGSGYAYDVYYSLQNGIVDAMERTDWELAFYTDAESGAIITNGAQGVELYTYPNGDTTAWLNVDTNGLSTWPVLFDGEDSWENGAFNRNSHGFPDYGWGLIDLVSGDIIGDSIYIIKLADGTYRQLWMVRKVISENRYIMRYADIDGGSEVEDVLIVDGYQEMNFAYYSFDDGYLFEREPFTADWDILFTRYQAFQPQGVYYPVTGVLTNVTSPGNRFHPVPLDFNDWFLQDLDTVKGIIGSNWKWFDFSTGWNLEDSLMFFINAPDGSIHKIYFTYFAGMSSGDIEFEQEIVSMVGIDDAIAIEHGNIQLSPNPAKNNLKVSWDQPLTGKTSLKIFDVSGKEILFRELDQNMMFAGSIVLDVSTLKEGMYIVNLTSEGHAVNEKLIIR